MVIPSARTPVLGRFNTEKKSSAQAAAALAATNAARQAEMEMKIEKLEKEIEFKKREIDAVSMTC